MARILILHASVGMGHYRAATALQRAFAQTAGTVARVEDTLRYARTVFRKAYAGSYLTLADHVPVFWSQFYALTDRPLRPHHPVASVRSLSTALGVHDLAGLLAETHPAAIICTHFLPAEVLGPLRPYAVPPVYMVVTDYRAHHFWACPGVDGYFVPTETVRDQLVAAGVARSQVHVTGIPIDPSLADPYDQTAARQALHVSRRRPVVLLNGSGIAPKRVRAIAEALLARRMPGTLLVAAGRNHELVALLADLDSTDHTEVRVLGQQPSLDPLIVASDLVVGKAGGLTVSEVLARGVPLIIPTPAPGQEQWNAAHVVQGGAGVCRETAVDVAQAVMALLYDHRQRASMAEAARALGRPTAALAIANHVHADLTRGYRPVQLRPARLTPAPRTSSPRARIAAMAHGLSVDKLVGVLRSMNLQHGRA